MSHVEAATREEAMQALADAGTKITEVDGSKIAMAQLIAGLPMPCQDAINAGFNTAFVNAGNEVIAAEDDLEDVPAGAIPLWNDAKDLFDQDDFGGCVSKAGDSYDKAVEAEDHLYTASGYYAWMLTVLFLYCTF